MLNWKTILFLAKECILEFNCSGFLLSILKIHSSVGVTYLLVGFEVCFLSLTPARMPGSHQCPDWTFNITMPTCGWSCFSRRGENFLFASLPSTASLGIGLAYLFF